METDLIIKKAGQCQQDMVKFAQALIQTPSISGDEKNISDLYIAEMQKLGYDEVFRDNIGNVVGIIKGDENGVSVMYNSHMDHVSPGNIANWQGYEPYGGELDICEVDNQDKTVKEKSECIHGRAASDVKGGAAVQIYAGGILAAMKREGIHFNGNFIFSGVVMEEPAEMAGMIHLVEKTFPERKMDYDVMISSEATSLKLYCGHRGRAEFLVTVTGKTSHASAPWLGINAAYKALPLLEKIINELDPSLPSDPEIGKAALTLTNIACLPGALSIVPDKCMLSIDRRLTSGETIEEATAQLRKIIDELSFSDSDFHAEVSVNTAEEISYTGIRQEMKKNMASWKIPTDHTAVQAAVQALKSIGQKPLFGYWDFGTDASYTAGIQKKPTIGYSPMQEQYAHTPYDKVRTDYMQEALKGNVSIFLSFCACDKEEISKPIE